MNGLLVVCLLRLSCDYSYICFSLSWFSVSIESQSQLLSSSTTSIKPLTYHNLLKSISPNLTTTTTYGNT